MNAPDLPIAPKHIYSRDFHYRKAVDTNLHETFARVRREMAERENKQQPKPRRVK